MRQSMGQYLSGGGNRRSFERGELGVPFVLVSPLSPSARHRSPIVGEGGAAGRI